MVDIRGSFEKAKERTREELQKFKERRAEEARRKSEEKELEKQAYREGYEGALSAEDESMLFDRGMNMKIEDYTRTKDAARKAAIRRSVLEEARRRGRESADREYRIKKARKVSIGTGLRAGVSTIGRQVTRASRNFADVDLIGSSYPFGGFGTGRVSRRRKISKRRFREPNLIGGSLSFGGFGNMADYDPMTGKNRKRKRR